MQLPLFGIDPLPDNIPTIMSSHNPNKILVCVLGKDSLRCTAQWHYSESERKTLCWTDSLCKCALSLVSRWSAYHTHPRGNKETAHVSKNVYEFLPCTKKGIKCRTRMLDSIICLQHPEQNLASFPFMSAWDNGQKIWWKSLWKWSVQNRNNPNSKSFDLICAPYPR